MMSDEFRFLYRFFFARLFQTEAGGVSVGVALMLLALPGTLLSLIMMEKYSALARFGRRAFVWDPAVVALPDKYLFLVASFTVAGIVAALRLDALFPDRHDHANLALLPISPSTILRAKAAALTVFMAAVILSLNIGSTLLFPPVVLESGGDTGTLAGFMAAHGLATVAAGSSAFAAVLALQGVLMTCLPYSLFRRVRRYVQFAAVAALVTLFVSVPACTDGIEALRVGRASWTEWLPTMWFLGLYTALQGHAVGRLSGFGTTALAALAMCFAAGALTWLASWHRNYLRAAEMPADGTAGMRIPDRFFTPIDAFVLRTPFGRGCFRLVVRTIARSDRHSAVFAGVLGSGAAMAAAAFITLRTPEEPVPMGVLASCLMLIYAALTALRLALSVPADARCVWLFQVISDGTQDPHGIAVRVMWCLAAPLAAVSSLLLGIGFGWREAALHLAFVLVVTAACIEVLTANFRVLPFTCSFLPARNNLLLGIMAWLAGLGVFGYALAPFESSYLKAPLHLIWFVALAAGLVWLLRRNLETGETLTWSDTRGEFDLLRLAE